MIEYRCWFCNKKYSSKEDKIGERRRCSCGRRLKVPRYSGGNTRARTVGEFLIEGLVYGGGLAVFCMAMAFLLGSRAFGPSKANLVFIAGSGVVGFFAGMVGGERVVDWVGQRIRGWEEDRRYGP